MFKRRLPSDERKAAQVDVTDNYLRSTGNIVNCGCYDHSLHASRLLSDEDCHKDAKMFAAKDPSSMYYGDVYLVSI